MRQHFHFPCAGEKLAASLDGGNKSIGLLIVSGGNEIRAGAFGGQAQLAATLAAQGFPVMRFDRRGVGDSGGENHGYRSSGADIAAALGAFRKHKPQLARIVAYGNCDAATALSLAKGAGCDGLVLANPWTFPDSASDDALPPPAAIRARYLAKLRDPHEWARLLRGGVNLGKLARGLKGASKSAPKASLLADEIAAGLGQFAGDVRILLAGRDRTAQAFAAAWDSNDPRIATLKEADHAFSSEIAREWLAAAILAALDEQARQLDMG